MVVLCGYEAGLSLSRPLSLETSLQIGAQSAPKGCFVNPRPKNRITKSQLMALHPCGAALTRYANQIEAGADSWVQVLKDESIDIQDRIWVGIQALPDDKTKRLFACWCAEQALNCVHPSRWDPCSLKAIEVTKRYVHGKATNEERQQARAAAADAYDAAAAAATAAATDAYDTTYAAVDATADAADAAYAAADAAAAAREQMRRRELKRLIKLHSEALKSE